MRRLLLTVAMVVVMVVLPLAVSAAPVIPTLFVLVKQSWPVYTHEKMAVADDGQFNIGGELFKPGGTSAFVYLRNMQPNPYPGNGANVLQPKVWLIGKLNGENRLWFVGYGTVYQPRMPRAGSTDWNLVVSESILAGVQNPQFAVQWQGGGIDGFNPNIYLGAYSGGDITLNITY